MENEVVAKNSLQGILNRVEHVERVEILHDLHVLHG